MMPFDFTLLHGASVMMMMCEFTGELRCIPKNDFELIKW
jgi:hypothetical protein